MPPDGLGVPPAPEAELPPLVELPPVALPPVEVDEPPVLAIPPVAFGAPPVEVKVPPVEVPPLEVDVPPVPLGALEPPVPPSGLAGVPQAKAHPNALTATAPAANRLVVFTDFIAPSRVKGVGYSVPRRARNQSHSGDTRKLNDCGWVAKIPPVQSTGRESRTPIGQPRRERDVAIDAGQQAK